MKQFKNVVMSGVIGLSLMSNIAKATSEEFKEESHNQAVKNSLEVVKILIENNYIDLKSLKDLIHLGLTSKHNIKILYNKELMQNFLSKAYQNVPNNIFGDGHPFMWVSMDTPKEVENRHTIAQNNPENVAKLQKQQVSYARWVMEHSPMFFVRPNDAEYQALKGIYPTPMEFRLAVLGQFDLFLKGQELQISIGQNKWNVKPADFYDRYNKISDDRFNQLGHSGEPLVGCGREEVLKLALNYIDNNIEGKQEYKFYFLGGTEVASGEIQLIP